MAKGRKKTPKKLLELRGSWRAKTRPDDLSGDGQTPTKPAWLVDAHAVSEWERCVKWLQDVGLVSSGDATALAMYCDAVGDYIRWRGLLDLELSKRKADHNGLRILHGQLHKCFERVTKGASLFGFTPISRTSLHVLPKAKTELTTKGRFFRGAE